MKKFFSQQTLLLMLLLCLFILKVNGQGKFDKTSSQLAAIKKLKVNVEANPSNFKLHEAFIDAYNVDDPALEAQYKIWMKQYPENFTISFAIGKAYSNRENPKAAFFLLRASILKPNNAEVWYLLSGDAYLRNNLKLRQEYLKKAMYHAPKNPDYAFNYASSFEGINSVRRDSLYADVVKRFPDSPLGDYASYLLSSSSTDQKIAYYQQLYNNKAKYHSGGYSFNMMEYFNLLINIDPNQAFNLANTVILEDKLFQDVWNERLKVASQFIQARKLLAENQPQEALTLLNQVRLDNETYNHHIHAGETLALFKAEVADAGKQTNIAFDSLAVVYSKTPTEKLHLALLKYGSKLGWNSNQVAASIWKIRDSNAKKATDFHLENYYSQEKTSLKDYEGKVVLLTYWFPGCGPCRAEFPHFESVLKNIESKDVAYIGLNIFPSQNEFVLPFLKASGYSFTPLQDDLKRGKGNLVATAFPTNYLLDQKGRIIFSNFTINAENEKTLELMIKETLAAKN